MDTPGGPLATHPRGEVTALEREAASRLRLSLDEPLRFRAEFLLGYVDLAIRGTLEYDRFEQVYLGPWWEIPAVGSEAHGWKRAVLRRVLAAGAQHWGHVFLIVNEGVPGRTLTWKGASTDDGNPEVLERIPLRQGMPEIVLYFRASVPERRPELSEFAREVGERFRRQMD